jgi:hypothetical protein
MPCASGWPAPDSTLAITAAPPYALDAAMHDSGNVVFVARVPMELVSAVEARMIYDHGGALPYNNVGKLHAPSLPLTLTHSGDAPVFD